MRECIQPYDMGRMAFLDGRKAEANPFMTPHGRLYAGRDWHRGWCFEREELSDYSAEVKAHG